MRRRVIVEEHLDDDAEEPADLGHPATLRPPLLRTRYERMIGTSLLPSPQAQAQPEPNLAGDR